MDIASGMSGMRSVSEDARRLLIVLTCVATINSIDRQVFGLLMPWIQKEFALSDTALGLLSGPAFGVTYALCGLPLAMLSDRRSRRLIISLCLALFSLAMISCGTAPSYAWLIASRMTVAAGEAGTQPASQSMIADSYGPADRTLPMSILFMSSAAGGLLGFLIGGWCGQWFGWRATFVALGVPGVMGAVLTYLLLHDPARGGAEIDDRSSIERGAMMPVPVWTAIRLLSAIPSYRHIVMASALWAFVGFSIPLWVPSFLIRTYGVSSGVAGTLMAFYIGIIGAAGAYGMGRISAARGRRGLPRILPGLAICAAISMPFSLILFATRSPVVAALAAILPAAIIMGANGPVASLVQTIAPPQMRATASALKHLIVTIVGLGIGPPVIGLISDYLSSSGARNSIGIALTTISIGWLWAAFHFWRASGTLDADIRKCAGWGKGIPTPGVSIP